MKLFSKLASRGGRTNRGGNRRKLFEALEGRQMFSVPTGWGPLPPPAGSAKLTGTVIGTTGSYQNKGNTIANAFDGNAATYFDGPTASGDWMGLNLGAPEVISQIQYVPRAGFTSRMVGGVFQGSNTADFSSGDSTLFTVTSAPASGVYTVAAVNNPGAFEFVRYLAPAGSYGNVSEIEFDGYSNVPTMIPDAPSAPVVTATTSADVHLSWTEDAASIVSSFTIERQGPTDPAFVPIGTTTSGTVTSFDDLTALASTSYSYAVVANNSLGSSVFSTTSVVTTPAPFINPWTDTDIGAPGKPGSAVVNPAGPITVTGGGADIWNQTDQFNFNFQTLTGNGGIVTQVTSQTNSNGWAKGGIMIRESANVDSRYVLLALTPGNGVTFQARTATHSNSSVDICVAGKAGVWLRLTRSGSTITGSVSADGINWTVVGSVTITMVNNPLAGLAVTAHNNGATSTATFANTTVTTNGVAASAWSDAATAPLSRWEAENFSYGGKLYVFGGFVDRNLDATAECDVYDPVANTWSKLTTVPTGALTHAAVTMVGDTAYFAGGDLGTFTREKTPTSTSEVLTYDVTTGLWGTAPSLPAAASCGGLAYVNNELVYFGGLNATDTADSGSTLLLDLTNPDATWTPAATMPDPRNHIGTATIDGIVYAVGGGHLYNETGGNDAEVDAYNPVTNTWTRITPLPLPMSSLETTTMVVNNKIVVIGGQTNGGYDGIYQKTILEFDPTTSQWTTAGTLPEANEGEQIAYADNELIVTAGTVDNLGGWAQNQTWVDSAITL